MTAADALSGKTLRMAPNVAIADLGNEIVILDSDSGKYFGVNEVGARVVNLLGSSASFDEVIDVLLSEYEIERRQLQEDVGSFVQALLSRGLITEDHDGDGR